LHSTACRHQDSQESSGDDKMAPYRVQARAPPHAIRTARSPQMAHAPGNVMAPFCRHRTIPGCPDAYRRCSARSNPRLMRGAPSKCTAAAARRCSSAGGVTARDASHLELACVSRGYNGAGSAYPSLSGAQVASAGRPRSCSGLECSAQAAKDLVGSYLNPSVFLPPPPFPFPILPGLRPAPAAPGFFLSLPAPPRKNRLISKGC